METDREVNEAVARLDERCDCTNGEWYIPGGIFDCNPPNYCGSWDLLMPVVVQVIATIECKAEDADVISMPYTAHGQWYCIWALSESVCECEIADTPERALARAVAAVARAQMDGEGE